MFFLTCPAASDLFLALAHEVETEEEGQELAKNFAWVLWIMKQLDAKTKGFSETTWIQFGEQPHRFSELSDLLGALAGRLEYPYMQWVGEHERYWKLLTSVYCKCRSFRHRLEFKQYTTFPFSKLFPLQFRIRRW